MKFKLLIFYLLFSLTTYGQDCTSCPGGSQITLDGSSYPASATYQWTCTDGFTSTLQSPTFNPTEDVTCDLLVTLNNCTVQDQVEIAVCDCDANNPCISNSYDATTECVTITNIGTNDSPVNTDVTEWKDDNTSYTTYNTPLCDCDVYEKFELSPFCSTWNGNFRLGANNFVLCGSECYSYADFIFAKERSEHSVYECGSQDYIEVSPIDFVNWGSSMIAYYTSNTNIGEVVSKVKYTYNGNGLDCNNITIELLSEGKIYKDIWGKRTVTYTDGCPDVVCEQELDIPQDCLLYSYIKDITSTACSGSNDAFYCNTINGVSPITYQWYRDGSLLTGETDDYFCISGQPYGEYCCHAIDNDGCESESCRVYQALCDLVVTITESGGILTANLQNCTGTASYEWSYDDNGTWVSVGGNSSTYNTGGVQGDYKVKATCSGCEAVDIFNYSIPCTASVDLAKNSTTITATVSDCNGNDIDYVWERDNNGSWVTVRTITTSSTTDSYDPIISGTYRCTITCDGCTDNESISFTIADPCADFTVTINGQSSLCVGNSYNYTYSATNGNPPFTQQWKLDGVNVGTGTSYTYSPSSTGSKVLAITVTDNEGCTYTNNKTLTTINCCSMTVDITPATLTKCINESGTFTANVSGGNSPYSYSWTSQISGGSVVGEGSGNPKTLNKSTAGTYNVEVLVTDNDGCQASDNATFTVDNCNDCDCDPLLSLDVNCILHIDFNGAGCSNFDWVLQFSETGTGWTTVATGGPPATNTTYTPTENGYYRLSDFASGCSTGLAPDVAVNCACTAPSDIWFDDGAGGNEQMYTTSTNYINSYEVNGCDGNAIFNTLNGLTNGKVVTISVSGDITLNSASTKTVGDDPMIDVDFTNLTSGSSTITVTYCNTDYVFNFDHDCCEYEPVTAELLNEGCYTKSDAGNMQIFVDFTSAYPTPGNSNYNVKLFINNTFVAEHYNDDMNPCFIPFYVWEFERRRDNVEGKWLVDMTNVLTQSNNTCYVEIWGGAVTPALTLEHTSGNLLTFDANYCSCDDFTAIINGGSAYSSTGTYTYTTTNGVSPFTQTWKIDGSVVGTGSSYYYTDQGGHHKMTVEIIDDNGCLYVAHKNVH